MYVWIGHDMKFIEHKNTQREISLLICESTDS